MGAQRGKGHVATWEASHRLLKNGVGFRIWLLIGDEQVRAQVSILQTLQIPNRSFRDEDALLEMDSSELPGSIILGCDLGDTSAFRVAARCRSRWPQTSALLISKNSNVAFTIAAVRSGVDGVLERPINSAANIAKYLVSI
jgi:FixJ family two-component response regulator